MTLYTHPLKAEDLRPEDLGAVIETDPGVVGRLVQVAHSAGGTTLELEGFPVPVYVFRSDIVGLDSATWERLRCDADRRIDTEKALQIQRVRAVLNLQVQERINRLMGPSIGWDEVGAPWE